MSLYNLFKSQFWTFLAQESTLRTMFFVENFSIPPNRQRQFEDFAAQNWNCGHLFFQDERMNNHLIEKHGGRYDDEKNTIFVDLNNCWKANPPHISLPILPCIFSDSFCASHRLIEQSKRVPRSIDWKSAMTSERPCWIFAAQKNEERRLRILCSIEKGGNSGAKFEYLQQPRSILRRNTYYESSFVWFVDLVLTFSLFSLTFL